MGNKNQLPGLGQTLRRLRVERGMVQQQVADELGVKKSTYQKWELGKALPDVYLLHKLSQNSGVSIDEIINQSLCNTVNPQ